MQRTLRKFIPAFLRRLDHDWLLNRPFLWATRIHYVLFFGLLGLVASLVAGLVHTISPADIPRSTAYLSLVGVATLLGLGYWWFLLSQTFSREVHESAIWRRNLILIMAGSLLLVSVPLSGWFVMERRAVEVRKDLQIDLDIDCLQKGLHFFESRLPMKMYSTYRDGQQAE
ncbi:MAG: hypothetical protein AAFQ68_26675, partial [Bacteroidota bacterium]